MSKLSYDRVKISEQPMTLVNYTCTQTNKGTCKKIGSTILHMYKQIFSLRACNIPLPRQTIKFLVALSISSGSINMVNVSFSHDGRAIPCL